MTEHRNHLSRRGLFAAGAGVALAPMAAKFAIDTASAAAPQLGASSAKVHRFKLGDFEITTILDGALQLDGPHPIFGQNVSADKMHELLAERFLPKTRFELGFTPVIVNTGKELVLFDTGNGAARRPNAGKLVSMLDAAGFSADQIDLVVITHCHPDHIGGLMEDGKPAFPKARYAIGEKEYNFWSADERLSGGTKGNAELVQNNVVPFAEKMTFLKPESEVVSGIRALNAFGHTPGHMAFHLESGKERIIVAADTANHYVASLQRPEWHVKFDMSKDDAAASRKRIFGMAASDKIAFTGYHMPFPSVGFVETSGPGFRYVPVSYQFSV